MSVGEVPPAAASNQDPSRRSSDAVLSSQAVDPDRGLAVDEVLRRRARDGPNDLRSAPPVPVWMQVLEQFRDPLVYLLLVAMVVSLLAWMAEGGRDQGPPVDVIVIAAIVVANAVLGFVQERKAADAVAALARITAATSSVVRDGVRVGVPSRDLVRGDILLLAEGDAVGADARLITATDLRVQEAALTGESEAVRKDPSTLSDLLPVGDRLDMVFTGSAVVAGVGRAVVTEVGMETQVGAIAELLERTHTDPSPLQRQIASISRSLGLAVILIAALVMATLAILGGVHDAGDLVTILLMGVSLAVAAVPEGLPAILSLVLALGVRSMARQNAVMKDLHSVETLGSASVICSDKTGTLTKNEMTLRRIVTPSGEVELTGTGYAPVGEAHVVGSPPGEVDMDHADAVLTEAREVLVGGALANNAQLRDVDGTWVIHGDPTEAAFLVAAPKVQGTAERVAAFVRDAEVPFTSERKLMSVLGRCAGDDVRRLITKGAPDILLARCTSVLARGHAHPLDDDSRAAALAAVERLSGQGYRTLGVACRALDPDEGPDGEAARGCREDDLTYLGVVGIIDPPRDEAVRAVRRAHRAGIRTIMITGDHPVTAGRIAADLGITEPGAEALTGSELDGLSSDDLAELARDVCVYARVSPEHKLRIIDALRANRHIVTMTGDGVNDAPALKSADIGIAMGISGTEVTKDAADMILGDDNFATIVAAVHQGRVIFDNIKKFLRYLLSSNLGEVTTVFFGVACAEALGLTDASAPGSIVVPLLATQILWINLVTDSGPALAMGIDPEIDDVMARPPRPYDDRILDRAMWARILFIGLVTGAVSLLAIDAFLPGGLIPGHDSLAVARTCGFTTLVFAQLFNALNSRSERSSAFRRLFVNPWLTASLVMGAALQVAVVQVPLLQSAFGTSSLDLTQWVVCLVLASLVLWVEEAAKWLHRRRSLSVTHSSVWPTSSSNSAHR